MTTDKIIKALKNALYKGCKWTIALCGNDKSLSVDKLRFIPVELFTGLNATQFQDALLTLNKDIRGNETTGDKKLDKELRFNGTAIRPMSLIRCAYVACSLMKMTKGRPTAKLVKCWTKDAEEAVLATDDISDKIKEKQNAINALKKRSERLALLGYLHQTQEEEINTALAINEMTAEISKLREELKAAKCREDYISVHLVKSVFLCEEETEQEDKTETKTETKTEAKTENK